MSLNNILKELVASDVELVAQKDEQYGSSWKRRGGIGAFMMLSRKWDRIEKMVKDFNYDIFKALDDDPAFVDQLIDLGGYLLLVRSERYLLEGKEAAGILEPEGGPDNNYIDQDHEEDPWSNMATDHARKQLLKIGDSELVDYYTVVYQTVYSSKEKEEFIVQLRAYYNCICAGHTPPVAVSLIMSRAKCVKSYRNPHMTNKPLVIFPDRMEGQ